MKKISNVLLIIVIMILIKNITVFALEDNSEVDNEIYTQTPVEEVLDEKEENKDDVVIPEDTAVDDKTTDDSYARVIYKAHVQKDGWQNEVSDGDIAGTTGKYLRMEAIRIKLDTNLSGAIEYVSHIQKNDWEDDYKSNWDISGTTGKYLRMEAIKIRLVGEVSEYYDIYYRVHLQTFGWQK